jgi:hypothetical protein
MNRFIACRLLAGLTAMQLCAAFACADNAVAKAPLPDAATRAQGLRMVDEAYKEQIAKAHTQAEKTALASDLIRSAGETKDKIADQFALYSKAVEIAAQAGDASTAFVAVDMISRQFEVDSLALQVDTLARLANTLKQTSEQKVFIEHCDAAIDEAVVQERYDVIKHISDFELSMARRYGDAASLKMVTLRVGETHPARIAFDKQKAALAALGRNPADPEANLVVGSYQCFIREDWKAGLPLLARCGDAALKSLAARDLAAGSDAQAINAAADGWWDRAAKERGLAQKHVLRRAAALYTEALPSLTGLAKTKAEKRCATSTTATGFSARGMTLGEVLTQFTFPNKTFHIAGDAITGMAETGIIWRDTAERMQSFEYGFLMKAKWYQMLAIDIDGHQYVYSRGHWGNGETMLRGGPKGEVHLPGKVEKGDAWASIKVRVAQNKATFFYNGVEAGSCDLAAPATPESKVKIGFSSYGTQVSIKDLYLVEK